MRFFILMAVLPVILSSGPLFQASAADAFTIYRLRTDQQLDLAVDDGKIGAFWSDWENRTVFTATCNRYIPELQKDDGTVTITVKAAATLSDVYLLFHFSYENLAPRSASPDIPIDRFSFALFRDSLARIAWVNYPEYRRLFFPLRATSGKVNATAVRLNPSDPRPGIFDSDIDGEVIEVDSVNTVVEITFPAQYLDQFADFTPHPGVHKAVDMRYYPSNEDPSHDTIADMFRAGDTGVFAYRLFLGEVFIDEHFDDSIYVFTSPDASTRLDAGAYYTVTWGYTVQGGILGMDYSPNDGMEWFNITTATANDGTHPWQVPSMVSDAYRLRFRRGDTVVALSELFSVDCPVPRLLPVPDSAGQVLFQWERVVNAVSYRILVDTAADFSMPFIDDTTRSTHYQSLETLPPGLLYWKVASNIDFGKFSTTDSFISIPNTDIDGYLRKSSTIIKGGIIHIEKDGVRYSVRTPALISIELVCLSGKTVCTLYSGYRQAGEYQLSYSTLQRTFAAGIHLLRYTSGSVIQIIPYTVLQ